MLAPTWSVRSLTSSGSSITFASFTASAATVSSSLTSRSTITNSSPPKRATVSPSRIAGASRSATIRSTWSPSW